MLAERKSQEGERLGRERTLPRLPLVHRELQPLYHRLHLGAGRVGPPRLAADHEVVCIVHDAGFKPLLMSALFPTQHEPSHVKIRQQRRGHAALRRATTLVLVAGCPHLPPLLVRLLDRSLQPHLHQMQQVPVADPASHALHQFVVRNRVEVAAQVRVDDFRVATVQPALDRLDRPVGVAAGPIGMLLRLKVLVEDRLYDEYERHLHHAVADRRDSQRTLLAVRLRYPHPSHGRWPVRLLPQLFCQFAKPLLHPVRLDGREGLPVHAWRAAVGTATLIRMGQYIRPVHLVIQRVEPVARRRFRFRT